MARWAYILTAFAALSAWAGAQNPAPPLSAEDRLRLLDTNSALVENLVRDGIAMSAADKPEDRAARCRDASRSLANEIERAARAENAERVVELTGLFRQIVGDGLVPTLKDAQRIVPPQSPAAKQLAQLKVNANNDVAGLKAVIPAGKLADNPRVKDALKQLDELAEALK
jgi:hypothetical protein